MFKREGHYSRAPSDYQRIKETIIMAYLVNGEETVATVKEVGAILGVKVTKKGILAGEYEGVEVIEDIVEESIEVAGAEGMDENDTKAVEEHLEVKEAMAKEEAIQEEQAVLSELEEELHTEEEVPAPVEEEVVEEPTAPVVEEPKEEVTDWRAMAKKLKQPEPKAKAPKVKEDLAGQEIEYPEVGHFESIDDIKKFYKRLSMEQISEWADIEGLEWKHNDNPGINRMRACMAISNHHFPKKSGSKKKAKYGHLTTEELLEMAIDNDIEVRDGKGNENILRMYTIMALKQAGILA
ncbi:hypothetical protein SHANETTE_5 [Bacillus phage Shanette]|uniref:Uncharacterized protein n=1 Tax=Bacillus phage Shanette TaxID=1296656 RepID=S5MBD8_9CAUD|nr:transcriptional regulator [Bacillus phage Shanette]AGR47114.1 hypothetical protein SHANETTE_5 [Bacillus phage Shanette]